MAISRRLPEELSIELRKAFVKLAKEINIFLEKQNTIGEIWHYRFTSCDLRMHRRAMARLIFHFIIIMR